MAVVAHAVGAERDKESLLNATKLVLECWDSNSIVREQNLRAPRRQTVGTPGHRFEPDRVWARSDLSR